MADKPSRALVVFGDGLASSIGSDQTHLHSLASRALCGFLSLPNAPSSETDEERIVREFAVLLDSFAPGNEGKPSPFTISERFMGMKAALVTENSSLKSFAEKLGLEVMSLTNGCHKLLLSLLGFTEGSPHESHFNAVFVHAGAGENSFCDIQGVNNLVGEILQEAEGKLEIGASLHLSVVMSYGKVPAGPDTQLSFLRPKHEEESNLSKLFPRQSYTMRGEQPREDVRHQCPMLMAQWQDAVTRRDTAETFSFQDFKERGANLVIPADRFLHEVAFKAWKAPKYGA